MFLRRPFPLNDAILTLAALSTVKREEDDSHPRPEKRSCQQQCCHCHARCQLMQHTVRARMTNFLATEAYPSRGSVPFFPHSHETKTPLSRSGRKKAL